MQGSPCEMFHQCHIQHKLVEMFLELFHQCHIQNIYVYNVPCVYSVKLLRLLLLQVSSLWHSKKLKSLAETLFFVLLLSYPNQCKQSTSLLTFIISTLLLLLLLLSYFGK